MRHKESLLAKTLRASGKATEIKLIEIVLWAQSKGRSRNPFHTWARRMQLITVATAKANRGRARITHTTWTVCRNINHESHTVSLLYYWVESVYTSPFRSAHRTPRHVRLDSRVRERERNIIKLNWRNKNNQL